MRPTGGHDARARGHAGLRHRGFTLFDALHGKATLRRDGGSWLVAAELVQIGKR